jgi:hypothetical protein
MPKNTASVSFATNDAGTTMLEWLGRAYKAYKWYKNRSSLSPALPVIDTIDPPPARKPSKPDLFETDFNGSATKVSLVRSSFGIFLTDAESGIQITAQRSLQQMDLESVPSEIHTGVFVNLTLQDGEIVSCLITPPDNEVYGSMRAFWWDLARGTIQTALVGSMRVTPETPGFENIFGQAREMWDEAIKQAGSIDAMRDLIMPMRNIHFKVISKMRADAEHPAIQLGLDIALAMVLATQAGDPKLEAYAFRCFNRFLWLPGEEPPEFRQHAA